MTNDPLERRATRNTARPWWIDLETMKELESCLKKLDRGISSSAQPLMANAFVRTAGQLMFTWSLAGVALEMLTSCDRPKLGACIRC